MSNAYEIVFGRSANWPEEIAIIDPPTGIQWTYKKLFTEVDRRAAELGVTHKRGDTLRLNGLWSPRLLTDFLAAEKIGLNCVSVPSPLIPAPSEIVGYPDGGAEIMFTSGTTGPPKSIVQNAERFAITQSKFDQSAHVPKIKAGELVGVSIPPVPAGFVDVMRSLMAGATLILLQGMTPEELWRAVEFYGINHVIMVTSAGTKLSRLPDLDLTALKWLVLVGEPITPKPFRKLNEMLLRSGCEHKAKLAYGSSEDGLPTSAVLDDSDEIAYLPIDGVRYRIANPDENGIGELEVYSDGVQYVGYYNDPEKTAARYTRDRWLKTGDIAGEIDCGLFKPYGRGSKRFADGSLFFADEALLGSIDGVFDVAILPTKGGGYRAHVVLEVGANKKYVGDKLRMAIRGIGQGLSENPKFWDWFPINAGTFKRDEVLMMTVS